MDPEKNLIEEFLAYLRLERKYSDNTLIAYRSDLDQIGQYMLANFNLGLATQAAGVAQVRSPHIRRWAASWQGSRRSLVRKLSSLRSYFKYLRRYGHLDVNPMGKIVLPRKHRELPVYLKTQEMDQVLAAAATPQPPVHKNESDAPAAEPGPLEKFKAARDACILEILYGSGLRRSELCALTWPALDLKTKTFRVRGKGNKERLCFLTDPAVAAIRAYAQACRAAGFSFTGAAFFVSVRHNPLRPNAVYKIVKHHLQQMPHLKRKSPHVLRHTYATHMVDGGADLNAVKELLGHSSLAATQVYVHNSAARLKQAYKKAHPRAQQD